jgi:hypothetical protein
MRYVQQLISDITEASENLALPFVKQQEVSLLDWQSPEEEDATAPVRNLPEWTGITEEMLPPASMLKEDEVHSLLGALNSLLDACNCHVVFQTDVPERFQYECIRQNFNQDIILRQWHMGFFALCKKGTAPKQCALGKYCQCAFYEEFFEGFIDENLSPEEERARALEMEVSHIRKKYGDDWMKYYPYHLDKRYDDPEGNPYDYGLNDDEDDEDNWWRK